MTSIPPGVARLDHLGVIVAAGEDAASFLQGQLTNDFALVRDDEARLAAYCSPKGRMLASFVGWKLGTGEFALVTSRDILPATLKRLSMFVLRAKCKLRDATGEFAIAGIAGDATLPAQPWKRTERNGGDAVTLYPADGVPRALWLGPDGTLPPGETLDGNAWAWSEVRAGVAMLTQPIVDAFVPQMLNYESTGGVNFKKGCYPGQEVVARSQFRGTLKRRAYLAHADAPLHAGQEVFAVSDAEQPCGIVAQAAQAPGGGWDAIVSMQVAAAEAPVAAGSATGAPLRIAPPPYPLLADV